MIKLSVNVNKIATLRNARGNNIPCLEHVAQSIINFGADGITVHPRPDERHIKIKDVFDLSCLIKNNIEFNIEGFPSKEFIDLVLNVMPHQVTLVPDKENVLTSLEGWDTVTEKGFLNNVIKEFKKHNIRTSLFIHPITKMVEGARHVDADRIELFTGVYAHNNNTVDSYVESSICAHKIGLGVNAGHDLDLKNLPFFIKKVPHLDEVSIGHALISEALFLGLETTIKSYQSILK